MTPGMVHHAISARRAYLYASAAVLIWAGFVLVSRIAGTSALNGFDLAALRFGIAACLLLPFWWWRLRIPLFTGQMLALTLTGGVGYALTVYWSFRYAPAAHGAVLLSGLMPFFIAALAAWLLHQPLSRHLWWSLLLIAIGVGCMARYSLGSLAQSWPGDLMMILGSILWSVYTVLVRRWAYSPWQTTTGVALLSALLYLPVYLLFLPKGLAQTPMLTLLWQGLYQGVLVVIVAMFFYMQAIARLGPTRAGTFMATVPALAGTGATVLLGEPFSLWLVLGLVFTSLGAWQGSRST